MKKHIVSLKLILLMSFTAFSQTGWFWNNPLPQGNTLRDVQFVNENLLVAVGYYGTFMKSSDKGTHWNIKHYIAGVAELIMGVHFVNQNIGYAVGSSGTITKTKDGGKNWIRQFYNGNAKLNSVAFANEYAGIIVGDAGIILRTTDGGTTWIEIPSGTPQHLFRIKMLDEYHATIIGDRGKILHTSDGGITWYVQESHSSVPLLGLSFLDTNTGLIVGSFGVILKTTDGGAVWDTLSSGTKQPLWGVYAVSSVEYIAVGGPNPSPWLGVILHSTNGGKSWTYYEPESPTLYAVSFNGSDGIIVGQAGMILQTKNSGATWLAVSKGNSYENYTGIKFSNPLNGYIAGDWGSILRTTDGGVSWSSLSLPSTKYDVHTIKGLSVTSDSVVTIVGVFHGVGYDYQVMRTLDGGLTWRNLKAGPSSSHFDKISFINDSVGLILWGSNHVSRTNDGGKTWSQYWTGVNVWLNSIILVDANVAYVAGGYSYGDTATVIKTTDGGKTWNKIFGSTQFYFLGSIYFTDPDHGNVIGHNVALRTSDGGSTWITQNISIDATDMHFADRDYGIAVSGGNIYRTTNGGITWSLQKSGTINSLMSIYMNDRDNAFVVGEAQTILQTKTGGAVSVKEKIISQPNDYVLSQNYPNPFSTSTRIGYSLTTPSHIRLVVTNILGQEVQKLVDQYVEAGEHSVTFEGSTLLSGMYFYKLETEKGIVVKKMMVIR